jgi:beta-galactosidase
MGRLVKPVDAYKTAMKLDQTRGFLNKNYWITEQLIGAQAHNVMGFVPRPGHAKLWSCQIMVVPSYGSWL